MWCRPPACLGMQAGGLHHMPGSGDSTLQWAAEKSVPDLTVVTRGSLLARTQTGWIVAQIEAAHPGLAVLIAERTTSGDRVQDRPLPEVGGKGLFTLELEEALRSGEADLAVH